MASSSRIRIPSHFGPPSRKLPPSIWVRIGKSEAIWIDARRGGGWNLGQGANWLRIREFEFRRSSPCRGGEHRRRFGFELVNPKRYGSMPGAEAAGIWSWSELASNSRIRIPSHFGPPYRRLPPSIWVRISKSEAVCIDARRGGGWNLGHGANWLRIRESEVRLSSARRTGDRRRRFGSELVNPKRYGSMPGAEAAGIWVMGRIGFEFANPNSAVVRPAVPETSAVDLGSNW